MTSSGDSVIVKTPRDRSRDAQALVQEHRLLRSLGSPPPRRLARPLALEDTPEGPALVLADAGKQHLGELLGGRPLAIDDFLAIAIDLAEAVSALHHHHILHRDINPSNVVIGPDGHATLVDFDAATQIVGTSLAAVGRVGTLHYMAPEQSGRMSRGADHRADLYSLGATFYEMLTGGPPFPISNPIDLVHAHLTQVPPAPHQVNPEVPELISDVVCKLLAKAPEERYRSADALRADLARARRYRERSLRLARFPLGRADAGRSLDIPDRLYGREHEREILEQALQRVVAGGPELVVIDGAAGLGKSALASCLDSIERPGRFSTGKAGPAHNPRPYAPWRDALRPLLREIVEEPEDVRAEWADRLRAAMGRQSAVLAELLPELAAIAGEQPPLPALGPLESEVRFHLALLEFARVLSRACRPLVLVLDDLQWADAASLKLIPLMASACPHLLLVAAFRSDEPGDLSRVEKIIRNARGHGADVTRLSLGPLDRRAIAEMLADTLDAPEHSVTELAGVLVEKTGGNALLLRQFLQALHHRGEIVMDTRAVWRWDVSRIRAQEISDDIELALDSIRRLSPEAQRILKIAACFLREIDLEILAAVAKSDPETVAARLWTALHEGVLISTGEVANGGPASYRFGHDRVQEAALRLSSEAWRRTTHRRIGRELARRRPRIGSRQHFDMVDHLDLAADSFISETERRRLVDLNGEAGASATAANAHGPALRYLERALELLAGAPDADRTLAFKLHRDAAECAYLVGADVRARELVAGALEHAATPFERADLANVQIIASSIRGDFAGALDLGRQTSNDLGFELPDDVRVAWGRELAELRAALSTRAINELRGLPPIRGEREAAYLELMSNLLSPAYVTSPYMFAFLAARMVRVTIENGSSVHSAFAYASLGMVLATLEQDYTTAHALGQVGVAVSRSFDDPVQECRTLHIVGSFVNHWHAPLRSTVPILRRAVERGTSGGELQFAVYAAGTLSLCRFHLGDPLGEVAAEIDSFLGLASRARARDGEHYLIAYRQAIRCLRGATAAPHLFDDRDFQESRYLEECEANPLSLALYHIVRLVACFLARRLDEALAESARAEEQIAKVSGIIPLADHAFLSSLAEAAAAGALPRIATYRERLQVWSHACPENYRHKLLLVDAEIARIEGRELDAARLYDDAIAAAGEAGVTKDEAIANELAGRFWYAAGRQVAGRSYLAAAVESYASWGALRKVRDLREEFSDVSFVARTVWGELFAPMPGSTSSLTEALDLLALQRASNSISSEVVLDRLLEKLLAVSMEVSGATRAALLLERDGGLSLQATAPRDESLEVPRLTAGVALERRQPVVIGDAANLRDELDADPALAGRSGSMLIIPIARTGRSIGVLYLENHLAAHAFGPGRVEALNLLSSQIAISLENSMLFKGLQDEIAERVHAEESLRFLSDASAILAQSLDETETLESIAGLPIPRLADWALARLVDDDEPPAVAHQQPERMSEVREAATAPLVAELIARAITGREPEVADARGTALPPASRSLMSVPLRCGSRCLGVMICGSKMPFSSGDRVVAAELGNRAGIALDKARLYRQAQEAIRLRDEFLSIASHELRTPLTSLRLAAQGLVRGRFPAEGPALSRVAELVLRQLERLTSLVDDLLSVSRLRAGRLELNIEELELTALVREVAESFSDELARSGSEISFDFAGPTTGRWDRARLDQVLTNLLSNALKFGLGKPIEVGVSPVDDSVRLTITDHGLGIPADRLPHIFDRFERAVSASQFGGLGLGLYIASQIVAALGGSIEVESTVGRETRFTVVLPREGETTSVTFAPESRDPAGERDGPAQ